MFENAGNKIKSLASVFLTVVAIMCIVFFLGTFILLVNLKLSFVWILGSILFFAIVFFLGYISTLLIYAFGELVENSGKIVTGMNSNDIRQPDAITQKAAVSRKVVPVKKDPDGSWACPVCGKNNPMGRLWCEQCNIEAVFEN